MSHLDRPQPVSQPGPGGPGDPSDPASTAPDDARDLAALRALRGQAPATTPAAPAPGRARLMAEIAREKESGSPSPVPRPRRPVWFPVHPVARRALVAGATAAAVAGGLVAVLPGDAGPGGGHGAQTVAAVLEEAATHAAQTQASAPRPGQWVLHDDIGCMRTCVYDPTWVHGAGDTWATGTTPMKNPPVFHVTPTTSFGPSDPIRYDPVGTYQALAKLPTEPHALLKRLSTDPRFIMPYKFAIRLVNAGDTEATAGSPGRHLLTTSTPQKPPPLVDPGAQFYNIVQILEDAPVIPPRINAALYRALAVIPGVELAPTKVRDAYGRESVTVIMHRQVTITLSDGRKIVNHFTDYLFLDPRTHTYQGDLDMPNGAGRSGGLERARRSVAVVDTVGELANGTRWTPYRLPARSPLPLR